MKVHICNRCPFWEDDYVCALGFKIDLEIPNLDPKRFGRCDKLNASSFCELVRIELKDRQEEPHVIEYEPRPEKLLVQEKWDLEHPDSDFEHARIEIEITHVDGRRLCTIRFYLKKASSLFHGEWEAIWDRSVDDVDDAIGFYENITEAFDGPEMGKSTLYGLLKKWRELE